jgi:hypothetical protein
VACFLFGTGKVAAITKRISSQFLPSAHHPVVLQFGAERWAALHKVSLIPPCSQNHRSSRTLLPFRLWLRLIAAACNPSAASFYSYTFSLSVIPTPSSAVFSTLMQMRMTSLKRSLPLILLSLPPLRHLLLTSTAYWLTHRHYLLPLACNSHPHPSTALAAEFTTHWTTHRCFQLPRCVWSLAALCSTCAPLREASPLPSARV